MTRIKEKRVPHILVECPELIPSVKLGVLDTLQLLQSQDKCSVRFVRTIDLHKRDLVWCDIFLTVRGSESITLEVARLLKQSGRRVLYFLDDDLLHIPDGILSTTYYKDKGIKRNIRRLIGLSDLLWCVNPRIGAEYGPLGNGKVYLGKVSADVPELPERHVEPVKLLYAGSLDHFTAVRSYLQPAVERICREFGDKVSMTYIGVNPGPSECPGIRHFKYFDEYEAYRRFVRAEGFSIGLAPIFTSGFYQSKYHNKYIEYSSIGAMGIYTDSDPYRSVIRDGWNGLLTENTVDAWYSAILRAVNSEALRQTCVANAIEQMRMDYQPQAVAQAVERAIPELISFKAPSVRIRYGAIRFAKLENRFVRLVNLFRNNGWRGLPLLIGKLYTKTRYRLRRLTGKTSQGIRERLNRLAARRA